MEQAKTETNVLEVRKQKRSDFEAKGTACFPALSSAGDFRLADSLHQEFGARSREDLDADRVAGKIPSVRVAGRIMLHRSFGKATFLTIQDRSGRIQIYTQKPILGDALYDLIKHLDLGDIVMAEGPVFKTKTGELTVDALSFQLLTKNLRPLPEKFHGLQDVESRYRKRYLDLITNEKAREVFKIRARVIQEIRNFFLERDYLEVETPMLHPLVGGARARPFQTFHNTLKMDLFLRIAPELYLKRLVVGGFERVFEINRCFRNEGISIKHNPEFTMLEFYEAYANYQHLMALTETLFERLAKNVLGSSVIEYQGARISLEAPYQRLTVAEAIQNVAHQDPSQLSQMKEALLREGVKVGEAPLAEVQWLFFEQFVESKLIQPTFVVDHPIEISPLARRSEARPDIAERFELYIAGREVANGFNELNDPEDQKQRFLDQLKRKESGDDEATDYDEDYIEALEVGLPPTAGEGIGIDRLVMLLTDSASIRDVILFPQLRKAAEAPVLGEATE